jgi:hypothetical protein
MGLANEPARALAASRHWCRWPIPRFRFRILDKGLYIDLEGVSPRLTSNEANSSQGGAQRVCIVRGEARDLIPLARARVRGCEQQRRRPNGFGFAPGDDGPGGNGNWNNQQDPDNSRNEGDGDYQGSGAGHYNSHTSCNTSGGPFSILNPIGGSRSPNPPLLPPTPHPPHNTSSLHANHAIPPTGHQ